MTLSVRLLPDLTPGDGLASAWERLVQGCPESGFMQSLAWAEVKRAQGLTVLHAGLFQDDVLIGGALCYTHPQPNGATLLIAPEGPVLPWHAPDLVMAGLQALIEFLEGQAPAVGAIALRIEPRLAPPRPPVLRGFGRAPIDFVPQLTLYRDVTGDDAALLAGMRPKGRYNIKVAARHGVQVVESTDPADARRLFDLVAQAGERDDFFVEPPSYFTQIGASLMPQGMARILFAEHEGETLGALLLITYGERATYLYGGISNEKRPLMAGYALQWAAMRRARELGCRVYDFFGYEPFGDPNHMYAGFSRFKRQFGGDAVRFIGAQDRMFIDRLADAVIRAFQEISPPAGLGNRGLQAEPAQAGGRAER